MLYIYIPLCLCEPLSFGGRAGREEKVERSFFLDIVPQKE